MSGVKQKKNTEKKREQTKKQINCEREIEREGEGERDNPFLPICGNIRVHVETLHIYAHDVFSRSLRD